MLEDTFILRMLEDTFFVLRDPSIVGNEYIFKRLVAGGGGGGQVYKKYKKMFCLASEKWPVLKGKNLLPSFL